METTKHSIDQDMVNAELFGNDVRDDTNLKPASFLDTFKQDLYMKIVKANNDEDLDAIGRMLDEAIDNHYNIDVLDYQFRAARKMTQLENRPTKPNYNTN